MLRTKVDRCACFSIFVCRVGLRSTAISPGFRCWQHCNWQSVDGGSADDIHIACPVHHQHGGCELLIQTLVLADLFARGRSTRSWNTRVQWQRFSPCFTALVHKSHLDSYVLKSPQIFGTFWRKNCSAIDGHTAACKLENGNSYTSKIIMEYAWLMLWYEFHAISKCQQATANFMDCPSREAASWLINLFIKNDVCGRLGICDRSSV
jgi:hypothetical protein